MADHPSITQVFQKMDSDSILERVDTGFFIDGRNLQIYTGRDGKAGAVRFIDGTVELFWTAPSGVNTGIGAYADETGDTLIAFIHNSNGNHSIIRYFPGDTDAHTITIPQLNLQLDKPVVGCAFVNQELLVFTDGGDYPKCINLPRADNTNKKNIIRVYFPKSNIVVTQRSFTVRIYRDGLPVTPNVSFLPGASSQQVWDFAPMFTYFARAWTNNATLSPLFTANGCGGFVELTAVNTGEYTVEVSFIDFINGVPQPVVNCISEYWNRYNAQFTDQQIRLAKIFPGSAPIAALAFDEGNEGNNIIGKVLQFQSSFKLKDNERVITSPISDIAVPSVGSCQAASVRYNCVDVEFDNPWLSDPAMRGEIEYVNLFVKEGNNGTWFKFATLHKWEWMYNRTFRFYNDGIYEPSDNLYNIQGSTSVPPVANALEMFTDTYDNQRIVMGGITEGDPNPCVDASVSLRVVPTAASTGTATLKAKCFIRNGLDSDPRFLLNQPIIVYDEAIGPVIGGMGLVAHEGNPETWNQKCPTGGLVMYAVGTNIVGISRQTRPIVPVSNGVNQPSLWPVPQGHPATGRNVYDGLSTGDHPGNPANDVSRAAARNAIKAIAVWQEFEIQGLVPGETYIFRMASNLCDYDTGDIYDLNSPTREYEKTSGNVYGFGNISSPGLIKPSVYECTVTVPLNGGGTIIDIGEINWYDTTNPKPLLGSWCNQGYLYDANGAAVDGSGGPNDIRKQGITAERQLVAFRRYETASGLPLVNVSDAVIPADPAYGALLFQGYSFTDHNGYFFMWATSVATQAPRAVWVSVSGNPGSSGSILSWNAADITTTYSVPNDVNSEKLEGNLSDPVLSVVSLNLFSGNGAKFYIFPNVKDDLQQFIRTRVVARYVSALGAPISGVSAILEWGKLETSDTTGTVEIIAYADLVENHDDRVNDRVVSRFTGACLASFLPSDKMPAIISQYWINNLYCDVDPIYYLNLGDITTTLTGSGQSRGFGRGAVHGTGYYLQRENGDRTFVTALKKAMSPALGQDLHKWDQFQYTVPNTFQSGLAVLDYRLGGIPPTPWIGRWAYLQFVITDDLSREWYIQWCASSVIYSSIWDSAQSIPTPSSFGNSTATEIYIDVQSSFERFGEMNSSSLVNQQSPELGYLWQQGDRVKILTNQYQVPLQQVIDVEITSQRSVWITVAATQEIPIQLLAGMVIEIYRPRKAVAAESQVFYDLPNGRINIEYDSNGNPSWASSTGTMEWGSTWVIPRSVPIRQDTNDPWSIRNYSFESKWIWDAYPSDSWGKGKPAFQDFDAKTEYRYGLMRYSDSYKQGTNINGLNFFNGLNFRITENSLGPIRTISRIGDVLFCLCENGAFSVYVGIEQLQTTEANAVQALGSILGTVRPFTHKHGTRHPMSVSRGTTNILYYDVANGAIVQYNSNALQDVAEQNKMHAYFSEKALTIPSGSAVCSGWDNVNGQFTFTFAAHTYDDGFNVLDLEAESITYFDKANAFVSKLDIATDFWGKTRNFTYSFKDGRLWGHGFPGAVKNNVHGVDLKLSIDIPFIGKELILKTPQYLWVSRGPANKLAWSAPLVRTDDGQVSMIPKEDFDTQRGGISRANFYADRNTPTYNVTDPTLSNGDPLMGTAFVVRLQYDGDEEPALINATLFYSDVTPT